MRHDDCEHRQMLRNPARGFWVWPPLYIRSHIRMYNRTYRCTFTYTYTSVRTPYSRHVAVCTNPLTARTDSRWIFMIRNDRQNTSLQYASCNVPQAHAMNNTSCCDLCRKVVLVVMNCSDSSFVWLPVISKQNLIRCSSQLRLLDSSLNWDSSLQLLLHLRCVR